MSNIWTCIDFESGLTDFREGRLEPETAAAAREHLRQCEACTLLLAQVNEAVDHLSALPALPLPAGFEAAVFARTQAPRTRRERNWLAWLPTGRQAMPRLALGLAIMFFTVGVVLDAAQVNLRQIEWSQLTPGTVSAALQADLDRAVARGVSFYDDLRVVYEIQAALHQMRQNSTPPAPGGRSRRDGAGAAENATVVAARFEPRTDALGAPQRRQWRELQQD